MTTQIGFGAPAPETEANNTREIAGKPLAKAAVRLAAMQGVSEVAHRLTAVFKQVQEAARTRQNLASIPDYIARDAGISRRALLATDPKEKHRGSEDWRRQDALATRSHLGGET